MGKIVIPRGALVFVGDGQKALLLRNSGDESLPNLIAVRSFAEENPPTHERGTDRPGRGFIRANANRRSSMETTDWHKLEKEHFIKRVASAMEQLVRADDVKAIVIVAPPRALAELRLTLHPDIKKRISAEVEKDLTKHTVWEI
jgi:protein required for attachment to host cells